MESTDVQKALLGRVIRMRGGRTIEETFVEATACGVTAEWFSDLSCRTIWAALETLFSTQDPAKVTLISVVKAAVCHARTMGKRDKAYQAVKIDEAFLSDCGRFVSPTDDVSAYAAALRAEFVGNSLRDKMAEINDALNAGEDSVTAAAQMQTGITSILTNTSPAQTVSVASTVDSIMADYEDIYTHVYVNREFGYTKGLSLPWRVLMDALGGFNVGLHIIAARPSVGKTSFALQLCRYWMENGVKCVIDTLDMSPVELFKRQIADFARVSPMSAMRGYVDRFQMDEMRAAAERLKKMEADGLFTSLAEADVDRLKAHVKILKNQGKIDVLVVDYVQKMTFRGAEKLGEYATVTRCSKVLHSIMLEVGIPVVALAQLNRESTRSDGKKDGGSGGREPMLSDLRSSGQLEQDAYTVLILHREDDVKKKVWRDTPPTLLTWDNASEDELDNIDPVHVIIAKAQNGAAGRHIPFVVFKNRFAWYLGKVHGAENLADKFSAVHDDWRHDPLEKVWLRNGVLISSAAEEEVERRNFESRLESIEAKEERKARFAPQPPPVPPPERVAEEPPPPAPLSRGAAFSPPIPETELPDDDPLLAEEGGDF